VCVDGVTTGFHSNESSGFISITKQCICYDVLQSSWLSSVSCLLVFCVSDMVVFCWLHFVASSFYLSPLSVFVSFASCVIDMYGTSPKWLLCDEYNLSLLTHSCCVRHLTLKKFATWTMSCHRYWFYVYGFLYPVLFVDCLFL